MAETSHYLDSPGDGRSAPPAIGGGKATGAMGTHHAILALRNAVQAFLGEHEESEISPLVLTDLANHDELAINTHPDAAFVWVVTTLGTHMVRLDGTVVDYGTKATERSFGYRYLLAVADVYRDTPMSCHYWDGAELVECASLTELMARYVRWGDTYRDGVSQ